SAGAGTVLPVIGKPTSPTALPQRLNSGRSPRRTREVDSFPAQNMVASRAGSGYHARRRSPFSKSVNRRARPTAHSVPASPPAAGRAAARTAPFPTARAVNLAGGTGPAGTALP